MDVDDAAELAQLLEATEGAIAGVLRTAGVADVTFRRGGFGATYERGRDGVSRYIGFRVVRHDRVAGGTRPELEGTPYFWIRLGEGELDGARYVRSLADAVELFRRWIVEWAEEPEIPR